MTKLIYHNDIELAFIDGEVVEVHFPPQSELEKAAEMLREQEGESITETLYHSAQQQREDRIENEHYKWGEPRNQ